MVNEQFTWLTPLSQQEKSGVSRRNRSSQNSRRTQLRPAATEPSSVVGQSRTGKHEQLMILVLLVFVGSRLPTRAKRGRQARHTITDRTQIFV
jgi:hypothetical protein